MMLGPREIRLAVIFLALVLLGWVVKGYREGHLFDSPPVMEDVPEDYEENL